MSRGNLFRYMNRESIHGTRAAVASLQSQDKNLVGVPLESSHYITCIQGKILLKVYKIELFFSCALPMNHSKSNTAPQIPIHQLNVGQLFSGRYRYTDSLMVLMHT